MGWIVASNILMAVATAVIALLTHYVRKSTQMQFVASMTAAFQNEWHNPRAALMRDYLHSMGFKDTLNKAIHAAYETSIDYKNIYSLLQTSELKGSAIKTERLEKFESCLKEATYPDPLDPAKPLFTAYQAIYEVLLSFDRLAVVRDAPQMMEKFIIRYRPPIRDLALPLQAFIAVRIVLRENDLKNYKKDYMHLLALLNLEQLNLSLFVVCKNGLLKREELSKKEVAEWAKIEAKLKKE